MSKRLPPPEPPQPEKAYRNIPFLNSPQARMIRVQCEMAEPAARFKKYNVNHTVVLFGSARVIHPDEAERNLSTLQAELAKRGISPQERDTELAFARRQVKLAPYYEQARELSYRLAKWSSTLPLPKRFVVCSGGGPGIMEAANRGAFEAGARSVALGISLPFEQGVNAYASPELAFEFHYFFIRKFWFFYLAKALVVFPGGFGTMDELFEVLTLIQTKKARKHVPVILFGSEFWNSFMNLEALAEWGTISREDLDLFKVCDTADEAMKLIQADFEEHFLKEPEYPQQPFPESSETD